MAKEASRLSSEQVVADLLRLGELLALHSRPIGALGLGRRIRQEESERLKAEIAKLEERIETQAYDNTRRALRSVLGLQKDEVLDLILLRCIAVVAFEALDNFRSVSTVAGVSKAVGLGDWSSTLDARHTIRQAIIKGSTISYSEEGCEGGVLKAGRNLIRFMSGENRLGILWTEESIRLEKEAWNRRSGDALKGMPSTSCQPTPLPPVLTSSGAPNLLTARGIYDALKDQVISLEGPLRRFSAQMSLHMRRLEQIRKGLRPSVGPIVTLLIGSSSSGKTWMCECAARSLGLPHSLADMSSVSQSAFCGQDLESCYWGLLANRTPPALAQQGLVVLDEFDKIASRANGSSGSLSSTGSDPQGVGIQNELLKPLDGCRFSLGGRRTNSPQTVTLDLYQTCYFLAGAFDGIRETLAHMQKESIGLGFGGGREKKANGDIRSLLVNYGLMSQIVHRIGAIIILPDPTPDMITRITTYPGTGLLAQRNAFLGSFGIQLRPTDEAVRHMAGWSCETKGYSRAVKTLLGTLVEEHLHDDKTGNIEVSLADVKRAIEETETSERLQQ